jgi:hypothetical protein
MSVGSIIGAALLDRLPRLVVLSYPGSVALCAWPAHHRTLQARPLGSPFSFGYVLRDVVLSVSVVLSCTLFLSVMVVRELRTTVAYMQTLHCMPVFLYTYRSNNLFNTVVLVVLPLIYT